MPKRPRRPARRYSKRPRKIARRRTRTHRLYVGKPMRPVIHKFKRTFTETIGLGATTPAGWSSDGAYGIYKQHVFTLDQLPGKDDFTNLFAQYKITGAAMRMYFSTTSSGTTPDQVSVPPSANLPAFDNAQILMRCTPAKTGTAYTIDDDFLNQSQAVKRRLCLNSNGKPVKIYTATKQLSSLYASSTNTDYALARPKMISTSEITTPHYGINMHLQRVDGLQFGSGKNNAQYVRIETTLYITCKQVQ